MGCRDFFRVFKDHIPILPHTTSIIILIINIFFPGFGTFWVEHLMIGLIQLFCTPFMIGWIWSLAWGIHTVRKSA